MSARKRNRKRPRRESGGSTSRAPARPTISAPDQTRIEIFVAAGVFGLALLIRLIYVMQIRNVGFFGHPVSDAFIFVERAREIAAGDWLGPADFVHAPLYAYVLGIIRILGDEVWSPRVVQCVFGAASCALLVPITRRLFGLSAAVCAGLLLAVYPPAVFFDGLIQKTSLALLLSTLLLWLLVPALNRASAARAAWAGVVLGLLALTRQNALALAPLVVVWIWFWGSRTTFRAQAARVVLCVIGLVAMLTPWAIRNRIVLGDFVLTTPNLGQNFAMGNNADATGTYFEFRRGTGRAETEQDAWTREVQRTLGRPPTAREVSDHYLAQSRAWIRENPGAWLRLMGRKWCMVWNAYEPFDTEDYYLYQESSALLRVLDRVFHFGVLAPLAAVGLVLTLGRWRRLWLLYGWLVVTAAAVALFVVFARYRFPLIPVLASFGAAGITEGIPRLRRERLAGLIVPAIVLLLVAVFTNWTIGHRRAADVVSYTNHATVLGEVQRYDDALIELGKGLRISPNHAGANLAMCNTLAEIGRYAEALPFGERARSAAPDYSAAWRGVGDALLGLGRTEQARAVYLRATELNPDDYRALNMLATTTAQLGGLDEALALFAHVLERAPDYAEAHVNLGNTNLLAGRLDAAAAAYERALDLQPDLVDALHNLGVVELDRGNRDRAIERFRRALHIDPGFAPARRSLAEAQANRRP